MNGVKRKQACSHAKTVVPLVAEGLLYSLLKVNVLSSSRYNLTIADVLAYQSYYIITKWVFTVQLVAFLLFRFVQTSTDVALSWANPTLICPGYLINFGAPAVPLDKTTNIEEFRRQQEKLEETIAMEEDSKSRSVVLYVFTSPSVNGVKYCDQRVCMFVCLSVCLSAQISQKPHVQFFIKFSVHVTRGRGSVQLRLQCDMLCTPGFVDDVMYSHRANWQNGRRCVCFVEFARWRHWGEVCRLRLYLVTLGSELWMHTFDHELRGFLHLLE